MIRTIARLAWVLVRPLVQRLPKHTPRQAGGYVDAEPLNIPPDSRYTIPRVSDYATHVGAHSVNVVLSANFEAAEDAMRALRDEVERMRLD